MKISVKSRKIGYTYFSQSGYFSFRGIKKIQFESRLEKDFLTSFAFSERVLDIEEQPFTLEYEDSEGKLRKYTPDFLVTFKTAYRPYQYKTRITKPMVVEVKPRDVLQKEFEKYRERFKAMVSYCQQNDMIFKIYDESRIHTVFYNNVVFLARYKRYNYDPIEADTILNYVNAMGQVPIKLMAEIIGGTDLDKAELIGHIYYLLATKQLFADLSLPLGKDTEVWINENYGNFEEEEL